MIAIGCPLRTPMLVHLSSHTISQLSSARTPASTSMSRIDAPELLLSRRLRSPRWNSPLTYSLPAIGSSGTPCEATTARACLCHSAYLLLGKLRPVLLEVILEFFLDGVSRGIVYLHIMYAKICNLFLTSKDELHILRLTHIYPIVRQKSTVISAVLFFIGG